MDFLNLSGKLTVEEKSAVKEDSIFIETMRVKSAVYRKTIRKKEIEMLLDQKRKMFAVAPIHIRVNEKEEQEVKTLSRIQEIKEHCSEYCNKITLFYQSGRTQELEQSLEEMVSFSEKIQTEEIQQELINLGLLETLIELLSNFSAYTCISILNALKLLITIISIDTNNILHLLTETTILNTFVTQFSINTKKGDSNLSSIDNEIMVLSLFGIGYLSDIDSEKVKSSIVATGILQPIFDFCRTKTYLKSQKLFLHITSLLFNLKEHVPVEQHVEFMEVISKIFKTQKEADIMDNILTIFIHFLNISPRFIELIASLDVIYELVGTLMHHKRLIAELGLKILIKLSNGEENIVESMIENSALECLCTLLDNKNKRLRLYSATLLSNFLACETKIVEKVVYHKIFQVLLGKIESDEHLIRKELVSGLCNATDRASDYLLCQMVKMDLVKYLETGLIMDDVQLTISILDAIENLYKCDRALLKVNEGSTNTIISKTLDEYNCGAWLLELQEHVNLDIYNKAFRILDSYFTTIEI